MPSPSQLNALLAMPVALRLCLMSTPSRIRPGKARLFSTSLSHYAKYPDIAAFVIPEFRTVQPAEIAPEELFKASSITSAPGKPLPDELTKLFIKNPPKLQYVESDFYQLKKNTRVPEVCILGRSNVGKSSFVNALAGRSKSVLAYVSSKAGKTRSINTYGFGPAPLPKDIAAQAAEYKGKEDIPTHTFHLVDMPGYGYASLKDWGHNITLYLTKRVGVKGAIVLIDAEVGPKKTDLELLELLSSAGKKTTIVLTKADKVRGGLRGLRETCQKLWDAIRAIESRQPNSGWAWEKDIFVTAVGAKDHDIVSSTVATARLAVARLAGLVADNRPKPDQEQKWTGKTISFEDLQFAPSKGMSAASTNNPVTHVPSETQAATGMNRSLRDTDPFAALECASADQSPRRLHRVRPRVSAAFGSHNPQAVSRPHVRTFYSSGAKPRNHKRPEGLPLTAGRPLRSGVTAGALSDFMNKLQGENTRRDHARNARLKADLTPPLPVQNRNTLRNVQQEQAAILSSRYAEDTSRIMAIRDKRKRKTQKPEAQGWELVESMTNTGGTQAGGVSGGDLWGEEEVKSGGKGGKVKRGRGGGGGGVKARGGEVDGVMTPDMFNDLLTGNAEFAEESAPKSSGKRRKRKGRRNKGKGKNKEKELKPVDEFEAKFSTAFGGG
ncbi:vacuolar protein sorting-associated protein 26 [Parahypoxylon ruwenzoriense]